MPEDHQVSAPLRDVKLSDKYLADGRVLISGTQALVRMTMMQQALDTQAGLKTGCFISGYRGSPLGNLDLELQRTEGMLKGGNVKFVPGVNEELAATAVWGSQQAGLHQDSDFDGVFGLWYGKGPGVDRTGDAFRHANLSGSAKYGGVLALLGDDHTCESSTTCHQSELAMVDAMIPTLNPAGIHEIVEFGLHGWAMSRFSGCWTGIKCVHDTVSSTASIDLSLDDFEFRTPEMDDIPADGLNIRLGDTPRDQEKRLVEHKLRAAQAYVRQNGLDRRVLGSSGAQIGIVTTGKSYLDVRQALFDLGIDEARANALGLTVIKLALVWPVDPIGVKDLCSGLETILVVEEKRALIEGQLRDLFFNDASSPKVIGKLNLNGEPLLRSILDLDSNAAVNAISHLVNSHTADEQIAELGLAVEKRAKESIAEGPLRRTPYFCAGCPHSSSTHLPDGSRGMAGIGCAWMSQFMERNVEGYTQMGGEGSTWIGEAPFSNTDHIFQNLGDGTYFHSGHLAIRAAVAAGVNITYKILYNDAVAMTGGQMHDGELTPWSIAWQVHAEGVAKIDVVTDEPDKYSSAIEWPPGARIHHRRDLDSVQSNLRSVPGTTVLIYDQTCAAEKRRRRKRKTFPDPAKRLFINSAVCEGCGDCGIASNCTAILPKETELGRKRQIDQSSCNKDYSCVEGFCPSFVTILDAEPRRPKARLLEDQVFPEPIHPSLEGGYNIVIAGVGGTGVVTVGALLAMAAHLEDKGCAILDMTGLAQKGGAVLSHLRINTSPAEISTVRIAAGGADLMLGFDNVVSSGHEALEAIAKDHTKVLLNTNEVMPGEFTRNPDLEFPANKIVEALQEQAGKEAIEVVEATRTATQILGNSIGANCLMMGFAYQRGLLPLSANSIEKAIEINGASVAMNVQAFRLGRQLAVGGSDLFDEASRSIRTADMDSDDVVALVEDRAARLSGYQNNDYANRYRTLVQRTVEAERAANVNGVAATVAKYYYKVLAYKDEYEVARLYTSPAFKNEIGKAFSDGLKVRLNLAPPFLAEKDKMTGLPRKREFGAWILPVFSVLAKMRWLRGTAFDPFGRTAERKEERAYIAEYEELVTRVVAHLRPANANSAKELLSLPEQVRGFGHVKMASLTKARALQAELESKFGLS